MRRPDPKKDNAPPAGEAGRGAEGGEADNLKRERTTSLSNEPACRNDQIGGA